MDKVPHGKGKQVYLKAKVTYWGEIDNNRINGQGRTKHDEGTFMFEGRTDHGLPLEGQLDVYDQKTREKKFTAKLKGPKDNTSITYTDGKRYIGSIDPVKMIPEGKGIMTYPDNSTYSGEWYQGMPHG